MVRKFLPRREIKLNEEKFLLAVDSYGFLLTLENMRKIEDVELDEEKFFLVFENARKLILVNSSLRNYENYYCIEKLF